MHISHDGNMFRGTHTTGPTHNYLGMKVGLGGRSEKFEVVVLPPVGTCQPHHGLKSDETRGWILDGVSRANRELKAEYEVKYAEIVENDSRRPEVYAELARRIILEADDMEKR